MAGKIYVGSTGVILEVTTGIDITGATTTTLKVKKPDDTLVTWTATIYTAATGVLRYTVVANDLDQPGDYHLQAYVVLSGKIYYGETALLSVYAQWE